MNFHMRLSSFSIILNISFSNPCLEEHSTPLNPSNKLNIVEMCQLCSIKDIVARDRWPKPLEHHKSDIDFLVNSAHDEYTAYKTKVKEGEDNALPESFLELLRLISNVLEELESSRESW